jgi:hypothetical protein
MAADHPAQSAFLRTVREGLDALDPAARTH